MNQVTKPSLFISVIDHGDSFLAIGSDTIDYLELESRPDQFEITSMGDMSPKHLWGDARYLITGQTRTIATAKGSSPLAAIGALIDLLRDMEKEETIRREKRQADIARFGGEVNEELIRKVVRWRKKQEKKQQVDSGTDYDEWDF